MNENSLDEPLQLLRQVLNCHPGRLLLVASLPVWPVPLPGLKPTVFSNDPFCTRFTGSASACPAEKVRMAQPARSPA
jgi:hypothetical protein